jgi:hypothetical protein
MYRLEIESNVGIGNIKIGMSSEQVHQIMGNEYQYNKKSGYNIDVYMSGIFQIYYDNNYNIAFIQIGREIINFGYSVFFKNINVFKTKADELITYFNSISKYDSSNPQSKLGYLFVYKDIGLSFSRSSVFKEEYVQEEWFQNMCPENQEDELKYRYFETVGMGIPDFWK